MSFDFKGRAKLAVIDALDAEERALSPYRLCADPLTIWFYRCESLSESRDLWLQALINFLFWVRNPDDLTWSFEATIVCDAPMYSAKITGIGEPK